MPKSTSLPEALDKVKQRAERRTEAPEQLSLWGEKRRVLPNDLARSALFTCANRNEPRPTLADKQLFSLRNFELRYTGLELRQDDLDLWLQVAHMASLVERRFYELEISSYSLLMALGKTDCSDNYSWLNGGIDRLSKAHVTVLREGRPGFKGTLLAWVNWSDNPGGPGRVDWRLSLHEDAINLFQPGAFSLVDWELRQRLGSLAKWLHAFLSTHRECAPYSVKTLYQLSGSRAKTLFGFRAKLKQALKKLKEERFLLEWAHEENGPDGKDVIRVRRNPARAES